LAGEKTLRERIRQRQPVELPIGLYAAGWAQGLIQLGVFATALVLLRRETQPVPVLLSSIAFGWAWFCLLMIGHDAMHHAFVPWRPVNRLVAFLTLDCLLFSRASWLYGHHVVHHARPFSKEDKMYLRADSVAGDVWNLLAMVLRYLVWDVTRLFRRPTWHEWLGMIVRITLFWSLLPLALAPAILFLLLFGNYLGLLAHCLPVARQTTDPVLRQLRTTWDLYPGSFVASLLTGGLNAHATHHVYPSLPRGAQLLGTRILLEEAGAEYRCVHTFAGLWTLFRLRQYRTFKVASIDEIAAHHLALELLPDIEAGDTEPAIELHTIRPLGIANRSSRDLRTGDRRLQQVTIAFPDRRKGDRRRQSVQLAA
jgi:fatty acid desaturase